MDKKNSNLIKIYSQPTTKKLDTNKLSINKVSCYQNPIKLKINNNNNTNITNFYQQKKRILLNNDSFEDNDSRSPFKKQRKTDTDNTQVNTPIISWDKAANSAKNLNIDCQLKVEPSVDTSISKEQINLKSNNNTNEVRIDQMLNEFHAKLQFNCLSKIDSGHNSNCEDDTLNSDFTLSNSPDELKKIENLIMQQKTNYSKESGISSCNSINPEINSPMTISKEQDKFKIPKTPIKNFKSVNTKQPDKSIQFFSTPKLITKQQNKKLNQTLNFKDISPIKGNSNDNILININSDNKRQFNDSNQEEDDLSSKKRNGKILFQNNKSNFNKNKDDNDFEDDSFDLALSQALSKIDDNELLNKKSILNNKLNNQFNKSKQLNFQKNHLKSQQINSKSQPSSTNYLINKKQQLKISNGLTNNLKSNNLINTTQSSFSNFTKSTKSSIQYSDDSSNIFATTTNRKSLNNLQNQQQIKKPELKKSNSLDSFLNDDEDDFICSQVVVNI